MKDAQNSKDLADFNTSIGGNNARAQAKRVDDQMTGTDYNQSGNNYVAPKKYQDELDKYNSSRIG